MKVRKSHIVTRIFSHVAIDLRGMRGSVRSSVRVLPEALPEIKQIPLNTVPSLIHNECKGAEN